MDVSLGSQGLDACSSAAAFEAWLHEKNDFKTCVFQPVSNNTSK